MSSLTADLPTGFHFLISYVRRALWFIGVLEDLVQELLVGRPASRPAPAGSALAAPTARSAGSAAVAPDDRFHWGISGASQHPHRVMLSPGA